MLAFGNQLAKLGSLSQFTVKSRLTKSYLKSIMALVGRRVYESPELVTMVQRCSDVTAAGSYDFDDVIHGGEAATSLLFDFLRQRLQANQGVATVLSTLRGIRMQMLTTAPFPHRCCQRCAGSCRLGRC
jgi:hypothetical protein